jgi:hypothetical protein
MTDSVNPGAPTTGGPFPNTNPALFTDLGETMAETRGRIMCGGACELSVDLAYKDYWLATPPAVNEVDACYGAGPNNVLTDPANLTVPFNCNNSLPSLVPLPLANACRTDITSLCRITIHYERHIHPLWKLERPGPDTNGDGTPDSNNKCNTCHASVDAANAPRVPDGQLDLSDGASEAQPLHFNSYRELLFGRRAQQLNDTGTALEDICEETAVDPVTMLEFCVRFQQAPASMSANGATASARFFNKMRGIPATDVDHSDFMSPSELRLLSEWLDIGAQYFNDPFTAPEN